MAYLHIWPERESAVIDLAEFIASLSAWDVHHRDRFTVALTGGPTARLLYQILAAPPYVDQISWDKWHVFWTDDACVSPSDAATNLKLATESLLQFVPIPARNIHPIDGEVDPDSSAEQYAETISSVLESSQPSLDLVLLEVEPDGSTASLTADSEPTTESERLVISNTDGDTPRVTFTLPLINAARTVSFLASGSSKASILKEIIEPEGAPPTFPAAMVRAAADEAHWFVDREAAALIKSEGL